MVPNEKELKLIESSLCFDLIERFVKSKEFISPFTIRLLANALNAALEKTTSVSNSAQTIFNRSDEVKECKLSEMQSKDVSEKEKKNGSTLFEDGAKNVQSTPSDFSSRILKGDYTTDMRGEKESTSKGDSPDLKLSVSDTVKNADSHVNKNNFFSSDSEDSDFKSNVNSDQNKSKVIAELKMKKKRKTEGRNSDSDTKDSENNDNEEEKLNRLLRMTSMCLNNDNNSAKLNSVKSGEKVFTKKKVDDKEITLLDLVNKDSCGSDSFEKSEEEKSEKQDSDDFKARVNESVKSTFLLSSSEFSNNESNDEENKKQKSISKKKNIKREKKKIKKDDLRKFAIPRSSSDSDDKASVVISESNSGTENKHDLDDCLSRTDEEKIAEDNDSTDFEEKPKIRRNSATPVISTDSSDSDIQQISIPKSEKSPIKGRKNINKILKKEHLEIGTLQARKIETERKKRLIERNKVFKETFSDENNLNLVLDFDPETKEELVVVDKNLVCHLKPHQREGVKFMWDCCFESLDMMESQSGSGCILAHCMGLGKTLQVITLVHTLLTYDIGVNTVMILCPLNTVINWCKEFKTWLKPCKKRIKVLEVVSCTTKGEKAIKIQSWEKYGGVFIMSYDIFRSMTNKKKEENELFLTALLDPGPDLVVCDEGHLLKNQYSSIAKCVSQIKTLRRIVLTGTPLQNNLIEYYCMVQFVKPNILGTRKEFMNGFVNPIKNGQFEDSTQMDVRIMKRRAHVLHSLLEGFIQRFGYNTLKSLLPEKQEYVISVSLTETQDLLYRMFVESCSKRNSDGNKPDKLFNDFYWLQKVWTHPRVLLNGIEKIHADAEKPLKAEKMLENCKKYIDKEEFKNLYGSGKLVILFQILKLCHKLGEKILVFSQFLSSLNLIENFLNEANCNFKSNKFDVFADSWELGLDYFRMDGSTKSHDRNEYCNKFNDRLNSRARLFLISTRAGGLGINLVAANRVIIFDVSWNPSHDAQSIFRVYRFGQDKPCYIYRLLTEATLEEKIYQRQVTKLSLAHRIVDEHQIERHYSMMNLHELYSYQPTPKHLWKVPKVPKDNLFAEILASNRDIIVGYHEHDSLLENKEDEELSEEERKAAWEDFEKERDVFSKVVNQNQNTFTQQPPFTPILPKEALPYDRNLGQNVTVVPLEHPMQLCKIVDVRTLNHPVTQSVETVLLDKPENGEPMEEEYYKNYFINQQETMQQMFPY